MKTTTAITLELPDEWIDLLRVLGDPAIILAELADHAQQGVYRPASWERAWLAQVFGREWTARLEPDPEAHWRQRPRKESSHA